MSLEKILQEPLRYPDRAEVDAIVNDAMGYLPAERRDLFARVSHAIRTPLAAILGFREILELDADVTGPDRTTYTEIIQSETWRLMQFLDSIKVLHADRTGTAGVERTSQDISETVASAVTRCSMEARTRNIRLEIVNLPEGIQVEADHDRMRLAFQHLLQNAVLASAKGGIVTVEAIAREDGLEVIVEDQGHGIDAMRVDELMKPFIRIPRTHDNGGELGIGLTIVSSVITRHGGTLDISSEPMEGTQVTVSIGR